MEDGFYFRHGLAPSHERPEIPGALQTVADVLDRGFSAEPDAEALVGRHARYRYGELIEESLRAAAVLADLGVRPGDRVAACLPNHTEIVVAFLGAMRVGAVWVGIPQALATPEKLFVLDDCDASVLLADPATHDAVQAHRRELRDLNQILVAEPGPSEWNLALARAESPAPPEDFDPFGPAAIAYTSGTTGRPKGVVHSQHNLLLPGAVAAAAGEWPPGFRQGVCLPLTILNLQVLGPLLAFQTRGCCVAMDRVDALGVAEWVRTERIGTFSAVPTMLHDLLTHPQVSPDDLESLVRPGVGGADLPESFRALYRERFGAEVTIGYGLTEAPTSVTRTDPDEPPVPGSCGRALPHVDVVIVDGDGAERPDGEVGEVAVRPARDGAFAGVWTPMLGYWNQPDATKQALRGGMLHTGDLGRLDADGNLFLTDRKNDLILRGGANVYPAEIERVLQDDPRVAACAVVARPDDRLGEVPVAFVQRAAGADAADDALAGALAERCRAELADYKVPVAFHFVDAFPRNAMGKIVKRELRERAAG
ncbi:MAG TPA: AMP-binding protein [Myxococcota bacterium]|nr:AMP-binding protein [Myxococcota bacterium]